MAEGQYNYLFKYIIIGDTFVGKSNILSRYAYNRFNPEHEITIGCEFMSRNISINQRNIRVQIWDTAGQEAFKSITRSYYKNTACALLVYDITDKKTFQNINNWLQEVRELCAKNVLAVLIGNKMDLEDKRQVTPEEGQKLAKENGIYFFETSALTGKGIEEMFNFSVENLIEKIESGKMEWDGSSSGVKLGDLEKNNVNGKSADGNKGGCCS